MPKTEARCDWVFHFPCAVPALISGDRDASAEEDTPGAHWVQRSPGARGTLPLDLRWSLIPAASPMCPKNRERKGGDNRRPCRRIESSPVDISDSRSRPAIVCWTTPAPNQPARPQPDDAVRLSEVDIWRRCSPLAPAVVQRAASPPDRRSTAQTLDWASCPVLLPSPHPCHLDTHLRATPSRQTARHQGHRRRWAHHRPRPESRLQPSVAS